MPLAKPTGFETANAVPSPLFRNWKENSDAGDKGIPSAAASTAACAAAVFISATPNGVIGSCWKATNCGGNVENAAKAGGFPVSRNGAIERLRNGMKPVRGRAKPCGIEFRCRGRGG